MRKGSCSKRARTADCLQPRVPAGSADVLTPDCSTAMQGVTKCQGRDCPHPDQRRVKTKPRKSG
eukprot:15459631-Alexandrium_andersonii.AAC.1